MCCHCPSCVESSSRTAEAAAALLHPEVWSGAGSRCGAVTSGGSLCTSRGSQCTSGGLGAPQAAAVSRNPARSRRLWPRCWNGRAASTGVESSRASKGLQQRHPRYPTQTWCDCWDSPVPLPAATRARRTLALISGNLYLTTRLGAMKRREIPRSRVSNIPGNHKWCFTGTKTTSVQAVRQLGNRQGNFKISYSISLHVEEMSTGKLPFASVMNGSLSQIQNKEVTNCLPAGREKPKNPRDFWEEHL